MSQQGGEPMPHPTVVREYAIAAVRRAVIEDLDDGTYAVTAPEIAGVVGFGDHPEAALLEFAYSVEDWVILGVQLGHDIPPLGAIDFSQDYYRNLVQYHE